MFRESGIRGLKERVWDQGVERESLGSGGSVGGEIVVFMLERLT
jgi:hypothetical protein